MKSSLLSSVDQEGKTFLTDLCPLKVHQSHLFQWSYVPFGRVDGFMKQQVLFVSLSLH